jgi:hypothetical protein
MKRALVILQLLLVVFAVGCEPGKPSPAPVSGKVTINGKAAANIVVTFTDAADVTKNATGKTDADGKYILTTDRTGDGARPGDYKITFSDGELITTVAAAPATTTGGPPKGPPGAGDPNYQKAMEQVMKVGKNPEEKEEVKKGRVPTQYGSPTSTPFTKKVEPGKNEFDFEITAT